MKHLIYLLIIVIPLTLSASCTNHNQEQLSQTEIPEITYSQALEYIDKMERSHQQVVDNPDWYSSIYSKEDQQLLGDIQFHKDIIVKYKQLRAFIINGIGEQVER